MNFSLMIFAPWVPHPWGNFWMHLFTMPTQYENLANPWLLNLCTCQPLSSSTITHAIPLTLIADMCWLKVTTVVTYGGTMTSDHGTVSKPGITCGLQPHEVLLDTRWYQGLWSWSIIVPQLMYSLSLDPLLEIHVRASSKFPKSLVSCNLPHILILTFKTTLVVLWTSCKLMCSTHFFFHYLTQGFCHFIILGRDFFKGGWL